MRDLINIISEADNPILEEGIRDTVEQVVDTILGKISTDHITYAQACMAYDRLLTLVGDESKLPYTKEEMAIGNSIVKESASVIVTLWFTLSRLYEMNIPLTAALIGAAVAAISTGRIHIGNTKRDITVSRSDREYRKSLK